MQVTHEIARDKLIKSKVRSREDYDRKATEISLHVGDRVLLYDESVRRGMSKKLSAQWIGPNEVIARDGVNATIRKGRGTLRVHVNRLKPFF